MHDLPAEEIRDTDRPHLLHLRNTEFGISYDAPDDTWLAIGPRVAIGGAQSIWIWNKGGRQIDVSAFDLLVSDPDRRLGELIDPENPPVTLHPDADLDDVATELVESRRSSLLVVDDDGKPLGRILSDDVLDALVPGHGRLHFPRLLQ